MNCPNIILLQYSFSTFNYQLIRVTHMILLLIRALVFLHDDNK